MKIPKIIHYCWFGNNEMPIEAKKCIKSWQENLKDYKFILWNEDSFDISSNRFVKEAYENRKYAFVTDYVRLYALYNYGGIYMDTDVEVLKPLDKFLIHSAFSSFENESAIPTGLMAAKKGSKWIAELLDFYNDRDFVLDNGKLYNVPNTKNITEMTIEKYGLILNNKYQVLKDDIHIYPSEYFCAKDWRDGKIYKTDNTYSIHHFMGSWVPKSNKLIDKLINIIGRENIKRIKEIVKVRR